MKEYKLLALSNPHPGQEDAFDQWHEEVHMADVLKVPGFVKAERLAIIGEPVRASMQPWRYAILYTIQSDDVEASIRELKSKSGTEAMRISQALDTDSVFAAAYEIRAVLEN